MPGSKRTRSRSQSLAAPTITTNDDASSARSYFGNGAYSVPGAVTQKWLTELPAVKPSTSVLRTKRSRGLIPEHYVFIMTSSGSYRKLLKSAHLTMEHVIDFVYGPNHVGRQLRDYLIQQAIEQLRVTDELQASCCAQGYEEEWWPLVRPACLDFLARLDRRQVTSVRPRVPYTMLFNVSKEHLLEGFSRSLNLHTVAGTAMTCFIGDASIETLKGDTLKAFGYFLDKAHQKVLLSSVFNIANAIGLMQRYFVQTCRKDHLYSTMGAMDALHFDQLRQPLFLSHSTLKSLTSTLTWDGGFSALNTAIQACGHEHGGSTTDEVTAEWVQTATEIAQLMREDAAQPIVGNPLLQTAYGGVASHRWRGEQMQTYSSSSIHEAHPQAVRKLRLHTRQSSNSNRIGVRDFTPYLVERFEFCDQAKQWIEQAVQLDNLRDAGTRQRKGHFLLQQMSQSSDLLLAAGRMNHNIKDNERLYDTMSERVIKGTFAELLREWSRHPCSLEFA